MATLAPPAGVTLAEVEEDDPLARARVMLTYLWRHRRLPDLADARRFTEQVQLRKLHDRDRRQAGLMDKIAAKALARDRLGPEWVTPTLWRGTALPDRPPFPIPAILKSRHGCNQYAALRALPTPAAWRALQARAHSWMRGAYGFWLSEWAYRGVPRELLAEPLIGDGSTLPLDYKIYVFGGVATHVQVHIDRGGAHRWVLHDRDYRQLVPSPDQPARPRSLHAMLAAAEELARDFDFLRIDFYDIGGRPRFGEFCLYPGSGLDPFAADWIDFELGALWRSARGTA
jgi:hypothetical protein